VRCVAWEGPTRRAFQPRDAPCTSLSNELH
jgi:hypothetical protein